MRTEVTSPVVISMEELKGRLATGGDREFWNVLTDEYYTGELIPGSRRVPLDTIGRTSADLPHDREIIVYCGNYDCPQSSAAGRKLSALGFTQVFVYEGGIQEWGEAGYPLDIEPAVAKAA